MKRSKKAKKTSRVRSQRSANKSQTPTSRRGRGTARRAHSGRGTRGKGRAAVASATGARANSARVSDVLRMVESALNEVASRGKDLLVVADQIGAAAIEKKTGELARAAASEQFLRDLADLRDAFDVARDGALSRDIAPFRLVPGAVLEWICGTLGIEPVQSRGKRIEVSREALGRFDIDDTFGLADSSPAIVPLEIVACGWTRGAEVLARPRARIARVT